MNTKTHMSYEKRARLIEEAEYELWKVKNTTYSTHPPAFWERVAKEFTFFSDSFRLAGFPPGCVSAIPNPYWPTAYYLSQIPWYEYHCMLGVIRAGWRKRVISLSWEFPPNKEAKIEVEESVTHEYTSQGGLIHAWSEEKFLAYLTKVRESLQKATQGSTP